MSSCSYVKKRYFFSRINTKLSGYFPIPSGYNGKFSRINALLSVTNGNLCLLTRFFRETCVKKRKTFALYDHISKQANFLPPLPFIPTRVWVLHNFFPNPFSVLKTTSSGFPLPFPALENFCSLIRSASPLLVLLIKICGYKHNWISFAYKKFSLRQK